MAIGFNVTYNAEKVDVGARTRASSNGEMRYKPAGVTIDWASIAAVSGADVTLTDGQIIKIGERYIRYGTVIYRHTDGTFRVATNATPLVPGECFIMDYTITDQDLTSPNFGGAGDNGRVYKDRIVAGGAGEPTWTAVYAALPNITFLVA